MLKETFGHGKPIIAMVHFPALPGSPKYDAKGGMDAIIESTAADIEKLAKHVGTADHRQHAVDFQPIPGFLEAAAGRIPQQRLGVRGMPNDGRGFRVPRH